MNSVNLPAFDSDIPGKLGIKQQYPIFKKLKGNIQFMYNMFDKEHRSQYTNRMNGRIRLEFTFKKKKASAAK